MAITKWSIPPVGRPEPAGKLLRSAPNGCRCEPVTAPMTACRRKWQAAGSRQRMFGAGGGSAALTGSPSQSRHGSGAPLTLSRSMLGREHVHVLTVVSALFNADPSFADEPIKRLLDHPAPFAARQTLAGPTLQCLIRPRLGGSFAPALLLLPTRLGFTETAPMTACPPSLTCTCSTRMNCEPPFLRRRRLST
jgi:hypothetical protein